MPQKTVNLTSVKSDPIKIFIRNYDLLPCLIKRCSHKTASGKTFRPADPRGLHRSLIQTDEDNLRLHKDSQRPERPVGVSAT